MSESKSKTDLPEKSIAHTPGPWTLDPDGLGVVLGPDGFSIQTAGPDCLNDDGGTAYANARLIAAAPELLAAAQFALEYW